MSKMSLFNSKNAFYLSRSLTSLCTATCQLFLFTQACILSYLLSSGLFPRAVNTVWSNQIRIKSVEQQKHWTSWWHLWTRHIIRYKAHNIQNTSRKRGRGSPNQSSFIYLLLYDSIYIHTALHTAWLRLQRRIERTRWRACLGSCCDLNANAGRVWMNWGSYYLHGWLWWTAHGFWVKYQSVGLRSYD